MSLHDPTLQIGFSVRLSRVKGDLLDGGVSAAAAAISQDVIEKDRQRFVRPEMRRLLASKGIMPEDVFALPSVLREAPELLGYYRLLLGYSQKEFFGSGTGLAKFKPLEVRGTVPRAIDGQLQGLCEFLATKSIALVVGIGEAGLSRSILRDLVLLTLGPQWRGGANNDRGTKGITQVFAAIDSVVSHALASRTDDSLSIRSATGRIMLVKIAPDPDIVILEEMSGGHTRNVVAIEVKAGTDGSNIHNRVGEAEKSHQKARQEGYTECWTVVNVNDVDLEVLGTESPSTNRFYFLDEIVSGHGEAYEDFRRRILSLTSIGEKP